MECFHGGTTIGLTKTNDKYIQKNNNQLNSNNYGKC